MELDQTLLEVDDLHTHFLTRRGVAKAVDGVSFTLRRREAFGLVGESGCGKSVTCLSILRLVPFPAGRIVGGRILFNGENLLEKSEAEMRVYRGKRIALIPQDPLASLNPVFTIGNQVGEALAVHRKPRCGTGIAAQVRDTLALVGIPEPDIRRHNYPHMMSGGMRQRVMGGIAIASEPDILIADEATTALDVTVQLQFLTLLEELRQRHGVAMIVVTHNLGVIARVCERVAVMYAGKIVETGGVRDLFGNPAHPYTADLLGCMIRSGVESKRLTAIPGQPPSLIDVPSGCRYAPRCHRRTKVCVDEYPPEVRVGEGHSVSCWSAGES